MDGQKQKPPVLARVHQWGHNHQSGLLFAAALTVVVAAGLTVLAIVYKQPVEEPNNSFFAAKPKPAPKPQFFSPLTGLEVQDEATTKRQVTAIMIENSPDARPQSGLKQAGIVYEAIAEGGITRFLTLYQEARPGLIGPVRSLRPYFVEWLAPYDAAIAHVGGSKRALDEVRNGSYKDIDQFFNAKTYWRSKDRVAPHNVYTSFENLDALNSSKGYTTSSFNPFARKADAPSKTPNANTLAVNISGGSYNSSYTYDKASNSFLRSQGGQAHSDREEGQIAPKVVIVMKVPTSLGFEDGQREQMQTSGSGQAYIFQDGVAQEVTWSKADARSPLRFTSAEGKDVPLNRGQTWITAIAPGKSVSWQ